MELIDQKTKRIMEECKSRARDAGLSFLDETLEYVVTNRDMTDLSPKNMIPTLYDYWVHDLQIFQERKMYELYPYNPYETVINTRPAISYYNDNNPDWLNVMIFYHVIGHIDFFQNNSLYKHTWSDDFTGLALADKRLIAKLRSEKGRWVDYIIEFTRGIDNLVGYYDELSKLNVPATLGTTDRVNFYFDVFLGRIKKIKTNEYMKEIDRYNQGKTDFPDIYETIFFSETEKKYPEFEALFAKEMKEKEFQKKPRHDLARYLIDNSKFLNDKENEWMKSVMEIVRRTSLYFEPQRRTKIMNEGWASYWHEKLFLSDERIKGHEVDFARINAKVMPMPRAGLNPYSLGWRLLMYIEDLANKGQISFDYQRILDLEQRKKFNKKTGTGLDFLFEVRENYSDFLFVNEFIDQGFVDRYDVFVVGKRLNPNRGVWEYYIKSKNADKYKQMLVESLYHPPFISVNESKTNDKELYLSHQFEGRPLVTEYIENTLIGIEYLYGGAVLLETSEVDMKDLQSRGDKIGVDEELVPKFNRVVYTMKDRKLSRKVIPG
ncbi:MAG: SpoVR family protein [bacterium]|nr:SpoVR family protein [bacterium]